MSRRFPDVLAEARADHLRLAECHGVDAAATMASHPEVAAANATKAAHFAFLADPSLRGDVAREAEEAIG